MLEELLEGAGAVADNVLAAPSLLPVQDRLHSWVLEDPGLGTLSRRGAIKLFLPKKNRPFLPGGYEWGALRALVPEIRREYLQNWVNEFSDPNYAAWRPLSRNLGSGGGSDSGCVAPETAAARIAAFLLDEGISSTWVANWLSYQQKYESQLLTLAELIERLRDHYANSRTFAELLVVVKSRIALPRPAPDPWLNKPQAEQWLNRHGVSLDGLRVEAGLRLLRAHWDIYAFLAEARDVVNRMAARHSLAFDRHLEVHQEVWIKGVERKKLYLPEGRVSRVVKSIATRDRLFELELESQDLDNAVQILSAADLGSKPTAITSLWATLEALFVRSGDRGYNVVAAKRAAFIATAALIRFELLLAMIEHRKHGQDALAGQLRNVPADVGPGILFEEALRNGNPPTAKRPLQIMASERLTGWLNAPARLLAIRAEVEDSLKRLYRQRNLVLHGGVYQSPGLEPTLRSASVIVSAVVDQIARISTRPRPSALEFAASVEMRLHEYVSGRGYAVNLVR